MCKSGNTIRLDSMKHVAVQTFYVITDNSQRAAQFGAAEPISIIDNSAVLANRQSCTFW